MHETRGYMIGIKNTRLKFLNSREDKHMTLTSDLSNKLSLVLGAHKLAKQNILVDCQDIIASNII